MRCISLARRMISYFCHILSYIATALCSEEPVHCRCCIREKAYLSTLMHAVILAKYPDTTKHKSELFQFFYFHSLHFTQTQDAGGGPMEKSNGEFLCTFFFPVH
jgi:hypothetical protein